MPVKVTVPNHQLTYSMTGDPNSVVEDYPDAVSVEADYDQLYVMGQSGTPKAIYAKGSWQKVVIS